MDKFQAAFEVLYFLSAVDGEVSKSEVNVVIDFLKSNQGNITFNPQEVLKAIGSLTTEGMFDELKHAALVFKENSSAQDRVTLLNFALNLIASDGELAENEKKLFFILGNTWNIDVNQYLANIYSNKK